jgi:hypothetical protein
MRSSPTISEFRIVVREVRISYKRIKQENEEFTITISEFRIMVRGVRVSYNTRVSSRRIRSSLTISEFILMVRGVRVSYTRIKQDNEEPYTVMYLYTKIKPENKELTNQLNIQNNSKSREGKVHESQAG